MNGPQQQQSRTPTTAWMTATGSDAAVPLRSNDDIGDVSSSSSSSAPSSTSTSSSPPTAAAAAPAATTTPPAPSARTLLRLLQCVICSQPLHNPFTLPCGNSLCHACIPPTFVRRNISFPAAPERRMAFVCPFPDCAAVHPLADCGRDVTLSKVMDAVGAVISLRAEEMVPVGDMSGCERLVELYFRAKAGKLGYEEDDDDDDDNDGVDEAGPSSSNEALLHDLRSAAAPELDCHICYNLLLVPITTRCGHTFCLSCVQQLLDHSPICPTCRKPLQLPSLLPTSLNNKRLTDLLIGLCPAALAERVSAASRDHHPGSLNDGLNTPIFVCTTSFPGMPTPLFIFEPRYRLMIRRAWEGDKRFGMVLNNRDRQPQGELGETPFMLYGTMLRITDMQVYSDGRSHIWTMGEQKFRIRRWGMRDGYVVADTERFDDLSYAEEEAIEALATAPAPAVAAAAAAGFSPVEPIPEWSMLPTTALLQTCLDFVHRMQSISAAWVTGAHMDAFGPAPMDPASFPYWIASLLPVTESEKHRLIASPSVRERLLIVTAWVKKMERERWFETPAINNVAAVGATMRECGGWLGIGALAR